MVEGNKTQIGKLWLTGFENRLVIEEKVNFRLKSKTEAIKKIIKDRLSKKYPYIVETSDGDFEIDPKKTEV